MASGGLGGGNLGALAGLGGNSFGQPTAAQASSLQQQLALLLAGCGAAPAPSGPGAQLALLQAALAQRTAASQAPPNTANKTDLMLRAAALHQQ